MYLFFKHTHSATKGGGDAIPIRKTKPSMGRFQGKRNALHTLLWRISTRLNGGEYWFYELVKDNQTVSYAEVCTGHWQFPFIGYSRRKYHIGPCFTIPEARGNGYYPMLLDEIINDLGNDKEYFMIVDDTNIASLRGVAKAGFTLIGKGRKNKVGQYVITEKA